MKHLTAAFGTLTLHEDACTIKQKQSKELNGMAEAIANKTHYNE